jgi:N6-adenosine-specific RNA methylase IME4
MDLEKTANPDTSLRPKGGHGMSQKNPTPGQNGPAPDPLKGLTGQYGSILIDPPWRFSNRTGKVAPEHRRLLRYPTMSFAEIAALRVGELALPQSHLYLWTPNALIAEALEIMAGWGYTYKTNLVWLKVRKDGAPDGRGVGFYFRNVTELLIFGVRGNFRTLAPGRSQVNVIITRKQEHSRKPDEQYDIIRRCSPGPYLELFARKRVDGWTSWGNQAETYEDNRPQHKGYTPTANGTDGHHKRRGRPKKTGHDFLGNSPD